MRHNYDEMMAQDEQRYRLRIPVDDAVAFALGRSDLGCESPSEAQRQLIGLLAVDALQYSEQWRSAAMLHACLVSKWPTLG